MRYVSMTILLFLSAPFARAQDVPDQPTAEEQPEAPAAEAAKAESESELLTATKLRDKVRTMRKNVLVGGPAVVRSEKEALRFYRKKINDLARLADDLRTQRDVKESEYDLALDTTLNARDEAERQQAARQASKLRAGMADLDRDIARLDQQGEALGKAILSIQRRMDQRKRMLTRFDRPEIYEDLPFVGDGLLDMGEDEESTGDPFIDEDFIDDLIRRDPQRARKVLFGASPELYWKKFPLTPPRAALKQALKLPAPDLPEQR